MTQFSNKTLHALSAETRALDAFCRRSLECALGDEPLLALAETVLAEFAVCEGLSPRDLLRAFKDLSVTEFRMRCARRDAINDLP